MKNPVSEDAVRIAARLRASAGTDRVIVFTAAGRREGVSAVACEVASALAQIEVSPVLIVDANLDSPACHRRFDTPREPGLAELLQKTSTFDQAVHLTRIDGLSLLPAGSDIPDIVRFLTSAAFSGLIEEARGRFAYVLIDTPPLMDSAETSVMAAESDGVVLVVRAGAHSRTEIGNMRRELQGLQARLLGAVLSGSKGG